jgi:hypothetical protein
MVGPGEGSLLAKLLEKEFEGEGISIAELKEHYQEVSVDIPDPEFHLKNLVLEYKPMEKVSEPIIFKNERSYSTKFRDKK